MRTHKKIFTFIAACFVLVGIAILMTNSFTQRFTFGVSFIVIGCSIMLINIIIDP